MKMTQCLKPQAHSLEQRQRKEHRIMVWGVSGDDSSTEMIPSRPTETQSRPRIPNLSWLLHGVSLTCLASESWLRLPMLFLFLCLCFYAQRQRQQVSSPTHAKAKISTPPPHTHTVYSMSPLKPWRPLNNAKNYGFQMWAPLPPQNGCWLCKNSPPQRSGCHWVAHDGLLLPVHWSGLLQASLGRTLLEAPCEGLEGRMCLLGAAWGGELAWISAANIQLFNNSCQVYSRLYVIYCYNEQVCSQ